MAGPGEREAIFRLRAEHINAAGWDVLPERREADEHDARALQLGAWRDGALVGAIRLVLPGALLPVEEAFELRIEPHGAVSEAGRLVIARAQRGDPAHRAWGALFARAWLTLRDRELSVLAGAAARPMIDRLRALGLPFEILGPAREHWASRATRSASTRNAAPPVGTRRSTARYRRAVRRRRRSRRQSSKR